MKKRNLFLSLLLSICLVGCNNTKDSETKPNDPIDDNGGDNNKDTPTPEPTPEPEPVDPSKVSSVKLTKKTITLHTGETYRVEYRVLPSTAVNQNVSFSSGDKEIAIVSSKGLVTAKKVGATTLTITTEDGSFTDTASIIVEDKVDATAITIQVPSDIRKDDESKEVYTACVGDKLQFGYALTPSNATNSVKWSATVENSYTDITEIISFDADKGIFQCLSYYYSGILITATTDNYIAASFTLKIESETAYHRNTILNKVRNSTAIEKEKADSGTFKIKDVGGKSSKNETIQGTFNIYSDCMTSSYTNTDDSAASPVVKTYDTYAGVVDDKYYYLGRNRDTNVYDAATKSLDVVSTSVSSSASSKQINSSDASDRSSLFHIDTLDSTAVGVSGFLENKYLSGTDFFGDKDADMQNATLNHTQTGNVYTLDSSYEHISSSTYSGTDKYYRIVSMTVTFLDSGMISKAEVSLKQYNDAAYDFKKHAFRSEDSKDLTQRKYTAEFTLNALTSSEREQSQDLTIEPSQCFYTSFDVYFTKTDGSVVEASEIPNNTYISVKLDSDKVRPQTATSLIDSVQIISSSNDEIVKNYKNSTQFLTIASGTTTLTISSSQGVQIEKEITVPFVAAESITATFSSLYAKTNASVSLSNVRILPSEAKQEYILSSYDSTNSNVTVNSDSFTSSKKGNVTVKVAVKEDLSIYRLQDVYFYDTGTELKADTVMDNIASKSYRFYHNGKEAYLLNILSKTTASLTNEDKSKTYATFDIALDASYTYSQRLKISNVQVVDSTKFTSFKDKDALVSIDKYGFTMSCDFIAPDSETEETMSGTSTESCVFVLC